MKWIDIEDLVLDNRKHLDRPFHRKDHVWREIQKNLKKGNRQAGMAWWKPLSGVAAAVLLGLLAVWGLHEYQKLTFLSTEMASSIKYYETTELRLVKAMQKQHLDISPDIRFDLKEIDQTQKTLKQALKKAPENKKEWIYSALIDSYELKIQLLEKFILYDQAEHAFKLQPNDNSL